MSCTVTHSQYTPIDHSYPISYHPLYMDFGTDKDNELFLLWTMNAYRWSMHNHT